MQIIDLCPVFCIESRFQTSKEGMKHSISSQAWRRRKLLGGHCECFEKQAFGIIIRNLNTSSYIVILTPGITNPKSSKAIFEFSVMCPKGL